MLQIAARLLLPIALSIITLVLGTLLLGVLPGGGLRTGLWALLLALVTVTGSTVAQFRRSQASAVRPRAVSWLPRPRAIDLVVGLLATGLAVGAVVWSETPLPASRALGYVELAVIPPRPSSNKVAVWARSEQQTAHTYRFVIQLGAQRLFDHTVRLVPGRRSTVDVSIKRSFVDQVLSARLENPATGASLRQVQLTIAGS